MGEEGTYQWYYLQNFQAFVEAAFGMHQKQTLKNLMKGEPCDASPCRPQIGWDSEENIVALFEVTLQDKWRKIPSQMGSFWSV